MGVKVSYNTGTRIVEITEAPVIPAGQVVGQQVIDVEIDLYSDAKEDWKANLDGNKRKNKFPFLTAESAGDALPGGQVEPAFFRFRNDLGWRILPFDSDNEVTLSGNIVPADPNLPIFTPRVGRTILIFRDGSQVAQMTNTTINEALATPTAQTADIHGQVQRSIYINTENGTNGNGYQHSPFNNWTDGVDYAEANGLTRLVILADATVDRQLKNFTIVGIGVPTIDLNGQIMDRSIFERVGLTGSYTGELQATECAVFNLSGMAGVFLTCSMAGIMTVAPGANLLISRVAPAIAAQPWTLNMNSGIASIAAIHNSSGGVIIANMDHVGDILHFNGSQGEIFVGASNTDGNMVCTGTVKVDDVLNGGTIIDKTRITSQLVYKDIPKI